MLVKGKSKSFPRIPKVDAPVFIREIVETNQSFTTQHICEQRRCYQQPSVQHLKDRVHNHTGTSVTWGCHLFDE